MGARLRKARQAARITQAQAAQALSVSRPTLIAIEKGTRRAKPDEIKSLADYYGTSVNLLSARDFPQLDLSVNVRSVGEHSADASRALALLNKLASAMVALERLLGVESTWTALPGPVVAGGSIRQQAEDAALAARHALGIGATPVMDIFSLLEREAGYRIFVRQIPSKLAGVFGYEAVVGPCILANANDPRAKQSMTAARAFGHFLANREAGGVIASGRDASTIEERFAKEFSHAFLMPGSSIRRSFHELVESNRAFTTGVHDGPSDLHGAFVLCIHGGDVQTPGGTGVDPRRHVRQAKGSRLRGARGRSRGGTVGWQCRPNSVRHALDPTCRLSTQPRLVV